MRKIFVGAAAVAAFFACGAQPAFAQTPVEDVVDFLPISDLKVELNDSPDPVGVGNTLTYKVSLSNGGPADTDFPGLLILPPRDVSVRVRTNLAPSVNPVDAQASDGGTCPGPFTPERQVITCTFDNLEGGFLSPGERARVLITTTATAQGFVRAETQVSSPNFDIASGSNQDREGTQVVPNCDGKSPTIVGTGGIDQLNGTTGKDVFLGLGGDDVIRGISGADTICAGDGDDRVRAGGGNDRVFGQGGDDSVKASGGEDYVEGNAGRDLVEGEENADQLLGGAGGDRLFGGPANDTLNGGADRDRCVGGPGSNTLVSCESS